MHSAVQRGAWHRALRGEQDIVLSRRCVRKIAERLGFSRLDRRRIVAAVSDLAARALERGDAGSLGIAVTTGMPPALEITIGDFDENDIVPGSTPQTPELPLDGDERPLGPAGRLVREFVIVPSEGGVRLRITEPLPADRSPPMPEELDATIDRLVSARPGTALEELVSQGRDMLELLDEVGTTTAHNEALTAELEETNRGVLALYSELEEHAERLRDLNETLEERVAERTAVAEHRAAQLQTLASELAQAEQRERRRIAQVLHDHLQQLLVAAKMNLGVLRKDAGDERLQALADSVGELLEESITASRTLTVELSPPILYDRGLAAALNWLARWMQEKHGLRIDIEADERAEPAAEEERSLLFEIARELLLNSVKHAATDRAWVRMVRVADDQVELIVRDEGRGFDASRAIRGEGTPSGFGLPSIRRRLELLGGEMDLDSAPGRGTTATVRAPIRLSAQPLSREAPVDRAAVTDATAEAAAQEPPRNGRIRVLLADDHEIVREGLAMLLARHPDVEIVGEASDGRMALELARSLRPDVVVMDINMPDINGLAATHHIRSELPRTAVIGLSLYAEADMARAMFDAGARAYLTKGGPSEELIAAVRSAAAE